METHYGEKVSALKYVHLRNFIEVGHALTYDVICIDEAQFFGDLFSSVITLVDIYGSLRRDCGWSEWRFSRESFR